MRPIYIVSIMVAIALGLLGLPYYKVWQQEKLGEAEWRRAVHNRKIKVEEANAERDAAVARAAADTLRAHGIARSNEIIGVSLKENEIYLQYLWLQSLEKNEGDIIYVPTEANFPIMEAGRLNKKTLQQLSPK